VTLISVAFGLLLVAWVFATTPFGAPDEKAHYLRAVNLAHGTLLGPKLPAVGLRPRAAAWADTTSRGAVITAPLAPPGQKCADGRLVAQAGQCLSLTTTGAYPPLPYLLPALAIRLSHHARAAQYLARLGSALACLVFIALAFVLLWSESAWSVLGLLAALTPEVLFISSVINPNGLMVVANLAFMAGLLRIGRARTESPRWIWWATTVSGATTILSWQLGWFFAVADVLTVGLLLGWRPLHEVIVGQRRRSAAAAAGLLLAAIAYFAYAAHAGILGGTIQVTPLGPGLRAGLTQFPTELYGWVGLFGLLDVSLPGPGHLPYWIWFAVLILLVASALAFTSNRGRIVLVLVTLAALAFPILFDAWVYRFTGFGLQPRHVMSILALVPMVSGELLFRSRDRIPRRSGMLVASAGVTIVALFQLFAWWENARTMAGLPNSGWFLSSPPWSPPAGWAPWAALAALGVAAMLVVAFTFSASYGHRRRSGVAADADPLTLPVAE
jgi:hypothetical protein